MPPSEAQIARYKRIIASHRTRLSTALVVAWDQLGSYTEDDVERYIARTAPAVTGAKAASVAASAAFFALVTRTRPVGVTPADVPVEPRITHPFLATWHALKEDRPWREALDVGRSQASAVGFDFVQSTSRRTGDLAAEASGERVRWQRVPGGSSCVWCKTVAGQTYRTAESADFGHDRCDCDAVPV